MALLFGSKVRPNWSDQKEYEMSGFITKALYKLYKRCPRLLGLSLKHPRCEHEGQHLSQHLATQGIRVGNIAQDQFKSRGAIEVVTAPLDVAITKTKEEVLSNELATLSKKLPKYAQNSLVTTERRRRRRPQIRSVFGMPNRLKSEKLPKSGDVTNGNCSSVSLNKTQYLWDVSHIVRNFGNAISYKNYQNVKNTKNPNFQKPLRGRGMVNMGYHA